MEFYNLYNTLAFYRRSIVTNLEKVDKNILDAIDHFDAEQGPDAWTKKYNLSQEMVKILQIYVKVLYLTESIQKNLQFRRNPENFKENSFNPSMFTALKYKPESTLSESKLNGAGSVYDSSASDDTIVNTETLVDITNKLIESEYGNRVTPKEEVRSKGREEMPSCESTKAPIKVQFNDIPTVTTSKTNKMSTVEVLTQPHEDKSPEPVKSDITSPKEIKVEEEERPKGRDEMPSGELTPGRGVIQVQFNYRPIVKKLNTTKMSTLELSSQPQKDKCPDAVKSDITSAKGIKVEVATVENQPPQPPQSEIKSTDKSAISSPAKPFLVEDNPSSCEYSKETPSMEDKSEIVSSAIDTCPPLKRPLVLPNENTLLPPPCQSSNELKNPFINPKTNPTSTDEPLPPKTPEKTAVTPEPKYTAVAKLLNMTFHDRKREAERRYEGNRKTEQLKWKVMPKSPSFVDRKVKEKSTSFEIENDSLQANQWCTIATIVSPTEFYVRTNQELFYSLENSLNEDLNNTYHYVVANYQSKNEAKTVLGRFCFLFLTDKHKWFRVEVVDWMEAEVERVLVQLIDYGDHYFCRYKNLKAMMTLYAEFPKMAVRCHFAGIYSPLSTDKGVWPDESVATFRELSAEEGGGQFLIIYAHRDGDSYGVDLTKTESEETLAQILVRRKLALEEKLPQDALQIIPEEDEDLEEFDGINEAISGYDAQDEVRICPFADGSGRCFKGPKCKLEHTQLSRDGITTDQVLSATEAMERLQLPAAGERITILITGYRNTCNFYAQIIRNRSQSDMFNDEFQQLKDVMNANNTVQTYEAFKVYPGVGEVVLVKHNNEWHRAKCVDHEGANGVVVFLVDFGITLPKKMNEVRHIKDDFLYLPFQAVECMLVSCCEKSNADPLVSWGFFQNCMQFQNFTAHVVESGGPLQLRLWDNHNLEMDYVLTQYGLGQKRSNQLWPKSDSIISVG